VNQTAKYPVLLVGFLVLAASPSMADDALPSADDLEAMGAVIGEITYEKLNVFDTTQPGENKSLFRLANRWHMMTRDSVIRQQLLFSPGDRFSKRLLAESERLLRQNDYLYDAKIEPVKYDSGVVDVRVRTRDLWTLMPGFSVSRSGGENRSRVSVSERNLLGRGVSLRLSYLDTVDRESTSFQYYDKNLGRSWTTLFLELADNSDGHTTDVRVIRPFYALDTHKSAGVSFYDNTREVSFYELGNEVAEYAADSKLYSAFVGWSAGLRDGWVRRWTAGLVHDERRFSNVVNGTLPPLIPADRTLIYPYIGFELLEDKFESTSNRDLMERTEDFYLGTRLSASLGFAEEEFGSDRDSVIYRIDASKGFGSIDKKALILSSSVSGRIDNGSTANGEVSLNARYYKQISEKRLFFMTLNGSWGRNLDLENFAYLGGDNGLRGYPLRYQSGDSKLLFTIEKRYYTDWYPFKLARVGGAIFADMGRTWGDSPMGTQSIGWLKDVGLGLRLVPTRASGRDVIHFDLAFPLDGDASIDEVQLLIESKRSF
jgi:outer membrane protein assembly factor BamA